MADLRESRAPIARRCEGILFPGLGQLRTRRPLRGIASLGVLLSAMVLARQESRDYQRVDRLDTQCDTLVNSWYATLHATAVAGYSAAAAPCLVSTTVPRAAGERATQC